MPPTLTNTARRVLNKAQEHGRYDGEGYVASEHMLLAMTDEPDSHAMTILRRHGVDLGDLRRRLHAVRPAAEEPANVSGSLPLTPTAKKAVENALGMTCGPREKGVCTRLMLAALVDDENTGVQQPLRESGADLQQLHRLLDKPPEMPEE